MGFHIQAHVDGYVQKFKLRDMIQKIFVIFRICCCNIRNMQTFQGRFHTVTF